MKPDPAALQKLLVEAVRDHNVLPLTGRCNLSCLFCSHHQNPPGTHAYDFPPVDESRLLALGKHLDPGRKIVIGESATRLREGEPLTHPRFPALIRSLRTLYPDTVIQVTTNGSLLTRFMAELLISLAPLELLFSLNSSSVEGRRLLMNDPQPLETFRALDRVASAGVPWHGSVVALPQLVGWEDLRQTLYFLNNTGAHSIRLLLPGFTSISLSTLQPPPGAWERCRDLAERLRAEFYTPLLLEPPQVKDLEPRIEGITTGSPAERAGLKGGDLILKVNGRAPISRADAFFRAQKSEIPSMTIFRDGRPAQISLKKKRNESPGFVVSYDLDPRQLERVRRLLAPGKDTLMLVSCASFSLWSLIQKRFPLKGLRLVAVPSFFFGGNINCAGLLTVSDFAATLRRLQLEDYAKVLIPAAAFDPAGFDLEGRHYSLLGEMGVAVTLVD
ncbi:MAG: DUF512 domain-containing protein [Dethiobacter sp.]|jgi:NifB/MoaA-like Fe-S oxidoreductase|nr:DUF512 domain-containing protein [Dethiobacter sp.]